MSGVATRRAARSTGAAARRALLGAALLVTSVGAVLLVTLVGAAPASALVIDAADGHGNTEPPLDLTGWDHVGRLLGGPSMVYLGNRWVLTANHVGAGVVLIGEDRYDPIADSLARLHNPDGSAADLLLFRIDRDPGLPMLPIARRPPHPGQRVVLVGAGAARGSAFTIDSPLHGLLDGYSWRPDSTKRWGTNTVADRTVPVPHQGSYTFAIPTTFERIDDVFATDQEAAAASGDSGGALFAYVDAARPERGYVLAGVLLSVSSLPEQPFQTTLYGGATYAADLSVYRDELMALTLPVCPEGADSGATTEDRRAEPACRPADAAGRPERTGRDLAGRVALAVIGALLGARLLALFRSRRADVP